MGPSSKRIVLAGGYGWRNLGDDAIAESLASVVSSRFPATQIVTVGGNHALRLDANHQHLRLNSRDPVHAVRLAYSLREASGLVIGGGGLLNDRIPDFYRPFFRLAQLARALRTPVMLLAVGVEPPRSPRFAHALRRLSEIVDIATVRDQRSAEVLEEHGFRTPEVVPDPAFAFPRAAGWSPDLDPTAPVLITLRPWWHLRSVWNPPRPDLLTELVQQVALAAERLTADGRDVVLLAQATSHDDDRPVLHELQERLVGRRAQIVVPDSPSAAAAIIADASLVISMRLHTLILALVHDVPCVGLSYDNKVTEIMGQAGADQAVVPFAAVTTDAIIAAASAAQIDHLSRVELLRAQASDAAERVIAHALR